MDRVPNTFENKEKWILPSNLDHLLEEKWGQATWTVLL